MTRLRRFAEHQVEESTGLKTRPYKGKKARPRQTVNPPLHKKGAAVLRPYKGEEQDAELEARPHKVRGHDIARTKSGVEPPPCKGTA